MILDYIIREGFLEEMAFELRFKGQKSFSLGKILGRGTEQSK